MTHPKNERPCPCCDALVDVAQTFENEQCPECGEDLDVLLRTAGETRADAETSAALGGVVD